ncbi:MAG: hypothetical protein ACLQGV_00265 [Bryobacteraceae bacterium]
MRHSREGAELGLVRQAQVRVREARCLLERPSVRGMEETGAPIQAALGCLLRLRNGLRSAGAGPERGELVTALGELRREILSANVLLEGAARFYLGWARLFYAAACGYTPKGEPATLVPAGRLSVEL